MYILLKNKSTLYNLLFNSFILWFDLYYYYYLLYCRGDNQQQIHKRLESDKHRQHKFLPCVKVLSYCDVPHRKQRGQYLRLSGVWFQTEKAEVALIQSPTSSGWWRRSTSFNPSVVFTHRKPSLVYTCSLNSLVKKRSASNRLHKQQLLYFAIVQQPGNIWNQNCCPQINAKETQTLCTQVRKDQVRIILGLFLHVLKSVYRLSLPNVDKSV